MTTEQVKSIINTGFGKKYENFTPITTAQAQAVNDLIKSMEPKKK